MLLAKISSFHRHICRTDGNTIKAACSCRGGAAGLSLPRGSEQLRPAMSPESSASDSRSPTPPSFPQQGDLRPRAPPPTPRAGDQEGRGCSHSPAPAEPLHLCPGAPFPPVSQTYQLRSSSVAKRKQISKHTSSVPTTPTLTVPLADPGSLGASLPPPPACPC